MEAAKLIPVPQDQVNGWWEVALPLMGTFFERVKGRYKPEHVLEALNSAMMQLWIVMQGHTVKAACLTEVMQFPNAKEFRIIMMVGADRELWTHFLSRLEEYARDIGCDKIIGIARPGWERIIDKMGYEKTHVYLEKDL